MTEPIARSGSFGEHQDPSPVDRLGVWLSERSVRRHVGDLTGLRIADIGCGHDATLVRTLLDRVAHATLLDLGLADDLTEHPKITALVGSAEAHLASIPDGSIDVTFCMSVLEHLWDDRSALAQMKRITREGGRVVINVPSWWGKTALEFSAFRLGLSPAEEMDDHKRYYDPRDLWPLLVEAGFTPHAIRCRRHKLGLNTFAVCTIEDPITSASATTTSDDNGDHNKEST